MWCVVESWKKTLSVPSINMEGKNPNMIDDEEKELSKRVTILT